MKQLKTYEGFFDFFKKSDRKMDIKEICNMYNIVNWTLVDGLVNVDGSALKFGTVTGYFDCGYNRLTSLKGTPQ